MKKIVAALTCLSLGLSLFAFDILDFVSVKEGVTEYTCTEYSVATKFGDYFKTVSGKTTYKLDNYGHEIETASYSPRGALESLIKSTYDAGGNIEKQEGYNSSDSLVWKTEYGTKKGARNEINDYDPEGNLRNRTILKYENDLLVDETGYDSLGVLIWKNTYKYDENQRVIKECQYQADGSLVAEIGYKYKDDGKLESVTEIDVMQNSIQRVFRYAATGFITEVTTYNMFESGNKVSERMILKYDDDGNLSKISDYQVAEKFGTTVNELVYMADYTYVY